MSPLGTWWLRLRLWFMLWRCRRVVSQFDAECDRAATNLCLLVVALEAHTPDDFPRPEPR
jgi:hypothetical protein